MVGSKRGAPSASTYAASHLSLSVLALLSSAGFSKSSSTAAHLLTEVLQRYIQLLGTTCVQHANHSGRNVVAPLDLSAALEHILGGGDPIEEVLQWAEDEGRLDFDPHHGYDVEAERQQQQLQQQLANGSTSRTNGQPASHPVPTSSESRDPLRDPLRGSDLRKRLSVGRPQPVADPAAEVHYRPIPPEQFEVLAEQSYRREKRIQELVWDGIDSAEWCQDNVRASVKAGKRKAEDSDAMDVDGDVHDAAAAAAAVRHRSRSGSPMASSEEKRLAGTDDYGDDSDSRTDGYLSSGAGSSNSRGRRRSSSLRPQGGVNGTASRSTSRHRHWQQHQQGRRHRSASGRDAEIPSLDAAGEGVVRRFGELEIDYVPSYLPAFPQVEAPSAAAPSRGLRGDGTAAAPSPSLIATGWGTDQGGLAGSGTSASLAPPPPSLPPPQDTDLEYIEQERQRAEAAQQATLAATHAAAAARAVETQGEGAEPAVQTKPEPTDEQKAAEAEKALEALQSRRVLRDCWREAIPFDSSTLGVAHPQHELGDLEKAVAEMASASAQDDIISIAPPTSSLRAFAADFKSLLDDPSTSGAAGIFLTPYGAAHQDAASKRRRLAYGIADPARYVPNDSLYGAVGARPVVVPFQPGPSWLVSTLPPPTLYEDNAAVASALSAPILTPVLPQGRPSALIPPSGSLVPPLAYRHPAHLAMAARIVSNGELLRRISRFDDPPPLLDDKHAERFFHGLPASRDLVGGSSSSSDLSSNISKSRNGGGGSGSGNTTLHAALEKLVLQLKDKEAVVLPEEDKEELQRRQQELQLQMQAAESAGGDGAAEGRAKGEGVAGMVGDSYASRIRNGQITMVHTWDWTVKDPFDPTLPGRRVRGGDGSSKFASATAPVAIEREKGKKKRESSANGLVVGAAGGGSSGGAEWSSESQNGAA
ncbi:uncharacterized protein PFL1_01742 [Pseudozyma flocculosa PF-1]|uniref:Bromodomain associated domain-containing protein n=1 Tax=Pseudozyma flocculosa TaxID=84751 RepID=A0A5C3EX23_9BASI|nr:uncharacterized protein PFL1_01742 [Pseudozyma flocculosa PF-1]EPQ30844.1 hypothetical protein PFL1_01742 [Pseudozyma flocculosa PF-1]SPO36784.1 uncharacterized protein PSFLO_02255 [Pseudozyma flocculosa]